MRVSAKMTMKDYDDYAREHFPIKVPDGQSGARISRVEDAIYDSRRLRHGFAMASTVRRTASGT